MITAPHPNQQLTPQEQWLRAAYTGEWYELIEKTAGGQWRSLVKPYKIEGALKHLADERKITGYRPEKNTRAIVIDIDHKKGYCSKYWHKSGESKEILLLQDQVEKIGCSLSVIRSSYSGGLHLYVSLPEAIPCWVAHWAGVALLRASGMEEGQGQAEVFPSRLDYLEQGRARSHGFRLPGQEGSALVVNGAMVEDGDLIYKQLNEDLENTEICHEWQNFIESAKSQRKLRNRKSWASNECVNAKDLRWTESGQSQEILKKVTTAVRFAHPNIDCPVELGRIIRETVVRLEGFDRYASSNTKKDLMRENGGIHERWARSSLRKEFRGRASENEADLGGDKKRNERLFKQSRVKLQSLWKKYKEAGKWSKRQVAKAAGMARATLEKHWEYWVSLLAYTPPSNGVRQGGNRYRKAMSPSGRYICRKIASKFDQAFIYLDEFDCFVKNPLKKLLDSSILYSSSPPPRALPVVDTWHHRC